MGKRRKGGEVWVECFSPVPCWHFSMMTRKALPSWPQCWAPCTTMKIVTMFQQSHQTKFLRSQKKREPRMEGTAEPWVPGQSSIALLDFHRNGLLAARTACPPSTGLHCSEILVAKRGREKNLLYCEWSDCASVSTGCPKRGHRRIHGFFAGLRTWWAEEKGTRWSMRQMVMKNVRLPFNLVANSEVGKMRVK